MNVYMMVSEPLTGDVLLISSINTILNISFEHSCALPQCEGRRTARKLYVIACVDKFHLKDITFSRHCYDLQQSTRGTNITNCFFCSQCIYIYAAY